ncbi:protein of unknown function [Nocardia cyriacigeorgica GUH-2]|uniref:Uncharacterized protein n=1 Tax=Nocardia cyriacigeorgica (strain GUH-2) TaxID=1127134 RepID=H6R092_NOCCG|nr:protein of unknown function [Nocardia cyriacigeorgica GUH-2]
MMRITQPRPSVRALSYLLGSSQVEAGFRAGIHPESGIYSAVVVGAGGFRDVSIVTSEGSFGGFRPCWLCVSYLFLGTRMRQRPGRRSSRAVEGEGSAA